MNNNTDKTPGSSAEKTGKQKMSAEERDRLAAELRESLQKSGYSGLIGRQRSTRLLYWLIRTGAMAAIYYYFWEHVWLRYTLILTGPLTLLSLFVILRAPSKLKRKLRDMQKQ